MLAAPSSVPVSKAFVLMMSFSKICSQSSHISLYDYSSKHGITHGSLGSGSGALAVEEATDRRLAVA